MVASRATTPMPRGTPTSRRSRTSASRTDAHAPGGVPVPGLPAGAPNVSVIHAAEDRKPTTMTALAASRVPRPRLRRMRPVLVVAAAIAVVAGSYVVTGTRQAARPQPALQAVAPAQPALSGPGDAP